MEPKFDPRFERVVKQTRIVRPPQQTLATFGTTTIRYHLVTEPSYQEIYSNHGEEEAVVRDGTVMAERPQVVTPGYLRKTEGFGQNAREYLDQIEQLFGDSSLGLLYTYKNEPSRTEIVSGKPDDVANRIGRDLDTRKQPLEAVIRGVDELWDVSLIKFIFELTNGSVNANLAELRSSGLMNLQDGVPDDARRRINSMIEKARRGLVEPSAVHKELERWGLFEEYQDRFFQLFRN